MERIPAIDFIKGALVIFMVVYHSLNYLGFFSIPHQYLGFIPHAFIMISGLIVTKIYLPRFVSNFKSSTFRLVIRSLKICCLFTFLNLGTRLVWSKNYYGTNLNFITYFEHLFEIYILGSPKIVAFEILLPISYILLISTFILKIQNSFPHFIEMCTFLMLVTCVVLEINDSSVYHLRLMNSGMIGMSLGLIRLSLINKLVASWKTLLLSFLSYFICVNYLKDSFYMQILSTLISLLILYSVGTRIYLNRWLSKQTYLLGKYSLLGYIIQIFYLALFSPIITRGSMLSLNIILLIMIITFLTWVTVLTVDYLRRKVFFMDTLYKFIFA